MSSPQLVYLATLCNYVMCAFMIAILECFLYSDDADSYRQCSYDKFYVSNVPLCLFNDLILLNIVIDLINRV